jgi:hypothetical protein
MACTWNGTSCMPSSTPTNTTCAQYAGNSYSCNMASGCQFINSTCLASQCKGLSVVSCTLAPTCTYYFSLGACYPK